METEQQLTTEAHKDDKNEQQTEENAIDQATFNDSQVNFYASFKEEVTMDKENNVEVITKK